MSPPPPSANPTNHSAHIDLKLHHLSGMRYWSYDFAHQPSRQECEETSPSLVFGHYALMQDDSWEEVFQLLFGGSRRSE